MYHVANRVWIKVQSDVEHFDMYTCKKALSPRTIARNALLVENFMLSSTENINEKQTKKFFSWYFKCLYSYHTGKLSRQSRMNLVPTSINFMLPDSDNDSWMIIG